MGLILDSCVVIAAERRDENVTPILKQIVAATGDQRAVLSSIGRTELVHGIYRAQSAAALNRREFFIRGLRSVVKVYPYTKQTAMLAGKIDGEQQGRGITFPFSDLLIGATALEVGHSLLTVDARHFRLISSLTVVQL
jgi:predicted nucleic acid-binding protein